MRYQSIILLFAVAGTGISATRMAALVPRDNTARGVNSIGGWSLAQVLEVPTCPADAPICGAQWCCPSTLACVHTGSEDIGEVCCPTDTDCSSTFKATPICADSSWSLWNATQDTGDEAGYFCCLQGQIGLQSGYCVSPANAVTAGPPAIQIAQGTGPVQSATSSRSGSGSVSTSASVSTSVSVSVSTSTSSGPASTVSVTVASSTGTSSSSGSSGTAHSSGSGSSIATGKPTESVGTGSTTTSAPPSPPASSTSAVVTGKSGAERLGSLGGAAFGGLVAGVFAVLIL